jgi:hypothetical protein
MPCADNQMCMVGSDCLSMSCVNNTCLAPTCLDMVHNGDETGTDCGGPLCPPCPPGFGCLTNAHCTSQVCISMICQPPLCGDGVENGDETDIDCGGSCPGNCPPGQGCNNNNDCNTNLCGMGMPKVCVCPMGMVEAPILGGGAYCIDTTEVTRQQYNVFWLANPLPNVMLPPQCMNNNRTPASLWPPVQADQTKPVVHVDWCDAWEYCAYFEKHLCGHIAGGPNDPAQFANTTQSEWFNACTAQGVNLYPYGSTFEAGRCYDGTYGQAVGVVDSPMNMPPGLCLGGAPGLKHMSGNAFEWEDSCDMTGTTCRVRGGSYVASLNPNLLRCDTDEFRAALPPNNYPDVGFRCCL